MTDEPRIEPIPINPMHEELLREMGTLVDRYRREGMPVESILGTICVSVGLLIDFAYQPSVRSVAVLACVKNIGEGMQ